MCNNLNHIQKPVSVVSLMNLIVDKMFVYEVSVNPIMQVPVTNKEAKYHHFYRHC